jgi:hypothetical protein
MTQSAETLSKQWPPNGQIGKEFPVPRIDQRGMMNFSAYWFDE